MDMNERREMLLVALRDGVYQFGQGYLRVGKDNKIEECQFCFFGVACEEYRQLHPLSSWWKSRDYGLFAFSCKSDEYGNEISHINPPKAVTDYFGIPDERKAGLFMSNDGHETEDFGLSDMADILEKIWAQ